MPTLLHVLEMFLSGAFNDKTASARADKIEWALLAFAALCGTVGIVFLAMALYLYLESLYEPRLAALVSSLIAFALAIVLSVAKNAFKPEKVPAPSPVQSVHAMVADLINELEGPIRENPTTSVTLAALAGIIAGRRL